MKKLTPSLAYLIGFWDKKKINKGVGIKGNQKEIELFLKKIIEERLIEPNKIKIENNKIYFHHYRIKKFFKKIIEERHIRFKYLNEYSSNYIAGIFDAVGKLKDNKIILTKLDKEDEIIFTRLGFILKKEKKYWIVLKPIKFLLFIKNWIRLKKDIINEIFNVKRK